MSLPEGERRCCRFGARRPAEHLLADDYWPRASQQAVGTPSDCLALDGAIGRQTQLILLELAARL